MSGNSTNNQENSLKTINELLEYKFVVPPYQCGYRWGDDEVRALLEDVWDYAKEPKAKFYCLQPVVVCEAGDKKIYNLIDGQQRLTTIHLILKYLGEKTFELEYQTGIQSAAILEKWGEIFRATRSKMDITHFENACRVIKEFFEDGKGEQVRCLGEENKQKFKNMLLESCKVLWYEPLWEQKDGDGRVKDSGVDENKKTAEEEIFVKFNAYKIRLTDEENIKALFLSKDNELDEQKIQERANFWYETELNLRGEDDFRYLTLCKIDKKDIIAKGDERMVSDNIMRIGVYLEAISGKSKGEMFGEFYGLYKNRKKPQEGEEPNFEDKWGELEECVKVFERLLPLPCSNDFDRELYHYLGFLAQCEVKPNGLYELIKESRGNGLQGVLKKEVKGRVSKDFKMMEELVFGQDSKKIKKLLLLFNIALCNGEQKNFEFNKYQLEQWSLEHIYPQNPTYDEVWTRCAVEYINSSEEYDKRDKDSLKNSLKNGLLEECFKKIITEEYFLNDGIWNLALLDRVLNSGLGNKNFAEKKKKLESYKERRRFIPIATQKVFDKDFEGAVKDVEIFTPEDQDKYFEVIKKAIKKFLSQEDEENK